jgi:hypothetical protein
MCGCQRASIQNNPSSPCVALIAFTSKQLIDVYRAHVNYYMMWKRTLVRRGCDCENVNIFAPGCVNVFWNGRWLFNWVCSIVESDVSMVMWRQFTNFIKLTLIIKHLETLSLWVGANVNSYSQILSEDDLMKLISTIPKMLGRVWYLLKICLV